MKLATAHVNGSDQLVVALPGEESVVTLAALYSTAGWGEAPRSMKDLLGEGSEALDRLKGATDQIAALPSTPVSEITFLPPVPDAGKIVGVAMNNTALNNTAHVEPAGPMFFLKPSSSLVGSGGNIETYPDYGFTFPELELGVIVGRTAKHVSEDDALDYVAGYTIVNDITSQGLKAGDSIAVDVPRTHLETPGYEEYFTWRNTHGEDDLAIYFTYHGRSKGTDTFGPMGPWLTTTDEITDPDALEVRGYADGELFALDSTASYSYPVRKIIAWASRYFTLQPGDVITCGTAAKGTEKFPRAHHNIDMARISPVVDIEIDGLGRLSNPVVHLSRD